MLYVFSGSTKYGATTRIVSPRKYAEYVCTGILCDCTGPHGVFWKAWKRCFKFQVMDMAVSTGGIMVELPNWSDLDRNPLRHRFHPLFSESEADVYRFMNFGAAETWQSILRRRGIETEVVPVKPAPRA
jgi:hypothetical protein